MTFWIITIGFVFVAALTLWLVITTITGRSEELPPPPRGFVVPPAEESDDTTANAGNTNYSFTTADENCSSVDGADASEVDDTSSALGAQPHDSASTDNVVATYSQLSTANDGPAYPLTRSQLANARFSLSPRGYRPSDVDRYIEHVLATVDDLQARLTKYERP